MTSARLWQSNQTHHVELLGNVAAHFQQNPNPVEDTESLAGSL
jgi:hypothetical protein